MTDKSLAETILASGRTRTDIAATLDISESTLAAYIKDAQCIPEYQLDRLGHMLGWHHFPILMLKKGEEVYKLKSIEDVDAEGEDDNRDMLYGTATIKLSGGHILELPINVSGYRTLVNLDQSDDNMALIYTMDNRIVGLRLDAVDDILLQSDDDTAPPEFLFEHRIFEEMTRYIRVNNLEIDPRGGALAEDATASDYEECGLPLRYGHWLESFGPAAIEGVEVHLDDGSVVGDLYAGDVALRLYDQIDEASYPPCRFLTIPHTPYHEVQMIPMKRVQAVVLPRAYTEAKQSAEVFKEYIDV